MLGTSFWGNPQVMEQNAHDTARIRNYTKSALDWSAYASTLEAEIRSLQAELARGQSANHELESELEAINRELSKQDALNSALKDQFLKTSDDVKRLTEFALSVKKAHEASNSQKKALETV